MIRRTSIHIRSHTFRFIELHDKWRLSLGSQHQEDWHKINTMLVWILKLPHTYSSEEFKIVTSSNKLKFGCMWLVARILQIELEKRQRDRIRNWYWRILLICVILSSSSQKTHQSNGFRTHDFCANDAPFPCHRVFDTFSLTSEHMHRFRRYVWNWLFRNARISRGRPTLIWNCKRNRHWIKWISNLFLRFHHARNCRRASNLQAQAFQCA